MIKNKTYYIEETIIRIKRKLPNKNSTLLKEIIPGEYFNYSNNLWIKMISADASIILNGSRKPDLYINLSSGYIMGNIDPEICVDKCSVVDIEYILKKDEI